MATTTKAKQQRTMRYRDGRLDITESGKCDTYSLFPVRDETGEAVLGYRCTKLASGESYDIDMAEESCECLGFLRWQKPCRHIAAVRVLRSLGMLES